MTPSAFQASNSWQNQLAQQQAAQAAQQQAYMQLGIQQQRINQITPAVAGTTYMMLANCTASTTTTTISGNTVNNLLYSNVMLPPSPMPPDTAIDRVLRLRDGYEYRVELPDGSMLNVETDGSYVLNDKNAKIVYRANRLRDFNRFLNVSDRIEEFIAFCGDEHVHSDEMLDLPMKLFVGWLVLQAARADKEPEPEVKLIPDLRALKAPRCHGCGRFIPPALRRAHIEFCEPRCFDLHYCRVMEAA